MWQVLVGMWEIGFGKEGQVQCEPQESRRHFLPRHTLLRVRRLQPLQQRCFLLANGAVISVHNLDGDVGTAWPESILS